MISAFFANSRTISKKTKNRKRVGREIGRPPEEHSVGHDSKADIKSIENDIGFFCEQPNDLPEN
ncbi:MAG: hypothetical protein IJT16_14660, partial [Lachnospiraceae bacterium]|nr:hypothetical protein [Lachnospiraceae bacterium]